MNPSFPHFQLQPISIFHSCFKQKTGTPRQFNLIPKSRGYFQLASQHLIDGLEKGMYIHVIWLFHENFHIKNYNQSNTEVSEETSTVKDSHNENSNQNEENLGIEDVNILVGTSTSSQDGSSNSKHSIGTSSNMQPIFITNQMQRQKIRPPRMNGQKIGVFAARSPYRPNPIGLSVCKINTITRKKDDSVQVMVEGCDLVEGTPILDIKPYIREYDSIVDAPLPTWFQNVALQQHNVAEIRFSKDAELQLKEHVPNLEFYENEESVIREVIAEMILLDPRSKYRREKCLEEVFAFCIDNINVRCIFESKDKCVVCEVEPTKRIESLDNKTLKRRNVEDYTRFLKRIRHDNTEQEKTSYQKI